MISFSKLGINGRLSNQMFQYAALLSLSLQKDYEFFIPEERKYSNKLDENWSPQKDDYFKFLLKDCFELKSCKFSDTDVTSFKKFEENYCQNDLSFFDIEDNTDINGYFCNEMYFKKHKTDILNEFVFNKHIIDEGNNLLFKLKTNLPLVTLHVRRGDYLCYNHVFDLVGSDYYNFIVKNIIGENNCLAYICSDDIEWCKKNLHYKNVYYSTHSNYVDLYVQSQSDYNIICNSTFSWWGAYLNKNQKVFRPNFYLKTKDIDPELFYLPSWEVI